MPSTLISRSFIACFTFYTLIILYLMMNLRKNNVKIILNVTLPMLFAAVEVDALFVFSLDFLAEPLAELLDLRLVPGVLGDLDVSGFE